MKKSTTGLLIGAFLIAILAYFFLFKNREKFMSEEDFMNDEEDFMNEEDFENEEGFMNMCQDKCKGMRGKPTYNVCITDCFVKGMKRDFFNWKCGIVTKGIAGPKCKDLVSKYRRVASAVAGR